MQLKLVNGDLMLCIDPDIFISFKESWVEHLSKLQYDKFGEYIKTEIYPVLIDKDRMLWNKSTISNKELEIAIQEYRRLASA